ncbi:MAG: DUF6152 family protein [Lautropia sp.]
MRRASRAPRHVVWLQALALALGLGVAAGALAHHGWRWTEDGAFELTGVITDATLGNPHGVLVLDADGERWQAEVGQPWRNERAGLKDAMLVKGVELTIVGKRSADPKERRVKAERVRIRGTNYDLYPERLDKGS